MATPILQSLWVQGGKIYALGGYNGRTRMSSGERYEPQRNQWEMIPSMHRQRSDASAATLHDKIYIVGGFNGQEVLDSVEVFDVETNQWSNVHSMISPRSGVSLVAFRDSLYALGGFSGVTRLSSGWSSRQYLSSRCPSVPPAGKVMRTRHMNSLSPLWPCDKVSKSGSRVDRSFVLVVVPRG